MTHRIALALLLTSRAWGQASDAPRPVRNDVPQAGEEVLVFRHQELTKGGHDSYYRISRDGVWPWYEKIGNRVVGQWQVIHPDGSPAPVDHDDSYRLARYASYEHWKATRNGRILGGDGPDYQANIVALRDRKHYEKGSDGAFFLQGVMATIQPHYMPMLEEKYEPTKDGASTNVHPVRNDVTWQAREIIALDRWKIRKGAADEFIDLGTQALWPYLEKVGARPVGMWKVIYPEGSAHKESTDYDEIFMMTRYAGYEHWKAAQSDVVVQMGGDGRDWDAYDSALRKQKGLTRENSVTFLDGYFHQSPPWFRPGLNESYRLKK